MEEKNKSVSLQPVLETTFLTGPRSLTTLRENRGNREERRLQLLSSNKNESIVDCCDRDCNFMATSSYISLRQRGYREVPRESQKIHKEKEDKSERRMPWLPEAMKDAVSCENPRGGANAH